MISTSLSRFTDDLISQAAEELSYNLDFKGQSADEKAVKAQIKRSYDVSIEEDRFQEDLLLEASVPTDSDSPRYELKISGTDQLQDQLAERVESNSRKYLEGAEHIEEGDFEVITGYIREDVWKEYLS